MPDYKKMYITLFNETSTVIRRLQEIQLETERMFLEDGEPSGELTYIYNNGGEPLSMQAATEDG